MVENSASPIFELASRRASFSALVGLSLLFTSNSRNIKQMTKHLRSNLTVTIWARSGPYSSTAKYQDHPIIIILSINYPFDVIIDLAASAPPDPRSSLCM